MFASELESEIDSCSSPALNGSPNFLNNNSPLNIREIEKMGNPVRRVS